MYSWLDTMKQKPILLPAAIVNLSGFPVVSHHLIEPLRNGYYRKIPWVVSGEAPKDFIRVYEHGDGRRAKPGSWPAYIAKVGVKWYPNESITEHLLTRLGQIIGVQVTPSRLMWVRGQMRFLSRYFLKPGESLIHGAEIFAQHLGDEDFVKNVENERQSRNVFTFQVVEESIKSLFPKYREDIMADFVRLLKFDAIVGNNDRHFYNWGVITDMEGCRPARLSPIYDTARALFWNDSEDKLADMEQRQQTESHIAQYVKGSLPKTGWDGMESPNHFKLIQAIYQNRPDYRKILEDVSSEQVMCDFGELLETEFAGLLSVRRKLFMLLCIRGRIDSYLKHLEYYA